ncbi:MAG TPA: fused MFS/spermidine synthase, partial [Gemmatimonadaceae bacterium]|nr:fused MFS/spermidine synthase [Gemmatimonadaceae bacterium]
MLALFAATTLSSAFLLFWIEPLFAKMVLPMLGGSPAVWNTCLMYFQAMLLVGYLYAHVTSRYLSSRKQAVLHVALLLLAVLSLPVGIPHGWSPPASGNVIPWLTVLLSVAVGAPFILLAATAPLVQRWLADTDHPAAANPYVLYAASNTGSLIGLLGFPIFMEPNLRLGQQANLWSITYGVAIVFAAACAGIVWEQKTPGRLPIPEIPAEEDTRVPTYRTRLRWIALAFVPSSLLLGVTTYLSTDVAAMPLLWVVPLALYLITFIIVFARDGRKTSQPTVIIHGILMTLLALALFWGSGFSLRTNYALHLAVFATTALVLHGELAASRPSPLHLTEFYLWMALGGALGGVFNAIVAPLIFKSITEYQLVLAAACFMRPSWRSRIGDIALRAPMFTFSLIPAIIVGWVSWYGYADHRILGLSAKILSSLLAAAILLSISGNALRFGVGIGMLLLAEVMPGFRVAPDLYADRSFFGAYRVQNINGPAHRLVHGTTTHGAQYQDPARRLIPETYYHPSGPVGQIFSALDKQLAGKGIGAIGLGAGTVLCYSKPGQNWTFFEIDPLVRRISSNPKYFSYLSGCAVRPRIVIGDARLSMAKEPSGRFSLLIVDAFSSDAIPVHLLTREAFALYERVLDTHGVLFVHISNKHLDLKPVVAALAKDAGLFAVMEDHEPDEKVDGDLAYSSEWVALARQAGDLGTLVMDTRWKTL